VSVSPAKTTTYTLTVTPASGTAVTSTATVTVGSSQTTVTVDPSSPGIPVTDQLLGMNMAAWYDLVANQSAIVDAFQTAGIKAVRWPGGSWSDVYHWQTNSNCQNLPYGGGTPDSNDVFSNFVNDIAVPAGLDVALTADYGTNPACNGGGEPSEAAAWATAALADGITVSHMTVGNEVYGSGWEEDLHSTPNDPATYAAAVVEPPATTSPSKRPAPKRWSASLLKEMTLTEDGTIPCWPMPKAPTTSSNSTIIHRRQGRRTMRPWYSDLRRI